MALVLAAPMACACEECENVGPGHGNSTLHRCCDGNSDCDPGQTCERRGHFEGPVETCEIACETSADCPDGHVCDRPPCEPDDIFCGLCTEEDQLWGPDAMGGRD
ncbi:MAG: hypothetical protein ACREE7_17695 [Dongiaceae bacterium]